MADESTDKASEERDDRKPDERRSVLAGLPRTRVQRASHRREDARAQAATGDRAASSSARKPGASNARKAAASNARKAGAPSAHEASPSRGSKAAATKTAQPNRRASDAAVSAPKESLPTPRQGYEADGELAGTPVAPPTGTELVGALAELAGELAQAGFSAGGRLLKGALSRLSSS